jgi:hypothetical protein
MADTDDAGPETRVALVERILETNYGTDFLIDPEQDAAEILADLRHYCDAHGLAFHELDRKAHGFYLAEVLPSAAA